MRISVILAAGIALGALTTASPAGQGIYRSTGTFGNHRGVDLTFATVIDALLGGTVVSAPATFQGSSSPTPAKVQGGDIRICDALDCSRAGPWSTEVDLFDGVVVQVRVPGPREPFGYSVASVQVMGEIAAFEVQGRGSSSLAPFSSVVVEPNRTVESGTSTFRGWAEAPLSIRGGEYRVCPASSSCGTFSSTEGVVSDGDQIQLRTVSGAFSQVRRVEVDVAGTTHSWTVATRARDVTPDAFSFASSVDVEPGSVVVSDPVVLSGHDGVDVSVIGGSYLLCPTAECLATGNFVSTPAANVPAGTYVRLRGTAPDFGETAAVRLTAGAATAGYEIRTRTRIETPDAVSLDQGLTDVRGVEPRSVVVSDPAVLQGFDAAAISVVGGEYSLNDGPFVSVEGIARDGDRLVLRHTSGDFSGRTSSTVRIGGLVRSWSSIVRDRDIDPEAFSFAAVAGGEPGSHSVSGPATLAGFDDAPISITGGKYSLNGGPFVSTPGTAKSGDVIRVQLTNGTFLERREITLAVGSTAASWSSTVRARDEAPDAFSFPMLANQQPNTLVVSSPVTLSGLDGAAITIRGGEYAIGDGAFTSSPGTVVAGDVLRLRLTTGAFGQTRSTNVQVGDTGVGFVATTRAKDVEPNAFSFATVFDRQPSTQVVSAPATLAGFDDAAISISGGEYSLNGGSFVSTEGTARPGDVVRLRLTTGAFGQARSANVQVGNTGVGFVAVVRAKDTSPDAFAFATLVGQQPATQVVSAPTTVSGFDDAPISITGGEYSLNGGSFVSTAGTVVAGDAIRVRLTTGAFGETRSASVQIGGSGAGFVAIARAKDTTPDAFSLGVGVSGALPGSANVSTQATLVGFDDASIAVSGDGASYSLNGAAFTTREGTARPGDVVRVQIVAGGSGEKRDAILTVGGASASFSVASATRDTTPDAFSFGTQTGISANTMVTSSIARLTGHDGIDLSVVGGSYQVCTTSNCSDQGTTFVTTPTTNVPAGRYVRVRTTTGALGATTSVVLTAGTTQVSFDATTRAKDTTPNAFSLGGPISGLEPGSSSISTAATLSGFDDGPISVSGEGAEYAVNGGSFGFDAATVASGDRVQVRVVVGAFGETRTATLDVGGTRTSYSATARARDTTPNAFSFTAVSNAQPKVIATSAPVVLNDHDGVDVSVTGGEYQICSSSTCGSAGEWTRDPTADVANGSWVRLRTTTADLGGRSSVVLSAGTASATWTATTRAGASCTTPWGSTIAHGRSVVAYQVEKATAISQCSATQTRECADGTLSGTSTYRYASCGVPKNVSVTCTSKAGNTQTITASDYNQDPLTARNPTNGGTWVVFRDGPFLNCLDMTNGNLDFSSSSICREYNGRSFTGGTNLRNCSWR